MEFKALPPVQFSKLNATAKDLINMGEWFLYEISYTPIPDAHSYLSTDQMSFFSPQTVRSWRKRLLLLLTWCFQVK